MSAQGQEFKGSVHVCGVEDLKELAYLYRCAYPQATDANVAADIKPHEAAAWITYRGEDGEILIAIHVRSDGLVSLLAEPGRSDSLLLTEGFRALAVEARAVLERYGVRGFDLLYAPSIEPLARRLESEGLVSPVIAMFRSCRFEGQSVKPQKVN